jgi:hypothetical protein
MASGRLGIVLLAAPFVQPLEQVFDDSDTRKRKTGMAATP